LKSKDASEGHYNVLYKNKHSKLAQLGVVLENALLIHILQQIKPYANPWSFKVICQIGKMKPDYNFSFQNL
jgi:hypothetical protein